MTDQDEPDFCSFFPADHPLHLERIDYRAYRQMQITQNSERLKDDGTETTSRGELTGHFDEQYRHPSKRFQVLGIKAGSEVICCCAYGAPLNKHRPPPRSTYARIDVVITDRAYRRMKLAHLLVFAALDRILYDWGASLYSISCLCAHSGMARIFEQLPGALMKTDARKGTVDGTIPINDENVDELKRFIDAQLPDLARQVRYRFRQARN